MKKTLYTYVLREQYPPVLICMAGTIFVLITGQLIKLMRILFASSCSLKDITELVLFAMPRLIMYAAPMAALLGVMLAFVRLNSDNELVAFRTAGTGFLGFLPPVLGVLVLVTILAFINTFWVLPEANRAFEMKLRSLGRSSIPALLEEGVFVSAIPKLVLFLRSVDRSDYTIKGIFIQDQRQPNEKVTISAESAQVDIPPDSHAINFRLTNGMITRAANDLKDAQAVAFKNYDFILSMDEIMGAADTAERDRSQMRPVELYNRMKKSVDKASYQLWSFELHQRIAFPSACLLLGLLGPPLGSLFRQRGRMTGITIGVGIFLAYYVLLSAGRTLGESNVISPFFAVWTPNLLSLVLAVYLWAKIHRETPFYLSLLGRPLALLWRAGFSARKHGAVAH
ncbi:MAG TPA: YjgP/YjgQ family permease [Deltaproteobacteria bacterium]|jgi:lipopolysaccharide export system permease protein|nr:YjgP/YjgQ family permease [Deltaproteobacteria bacterium]